MAVLRYCLHRRDDNSEVMVGIQDAEDFLRQKVRESWKTLPMLYRMGSPEQSVMLALERALKDVREVLMTQSTRV